LQPAPYSGAAALVRAFTKIRADRERSRYLALMRRDASPSRVAAGLGSRNRCRVRRGAAVAVVGAGILVAGCGSSGSSLAGKIARAAAVSSSAPGYRAQMHVSVSSPALPAPVTEEALGSFAPAAHAGQMMMRIKLPAATAAQLGSSQLTETAVLRGTTMYVRLPAMVAARLPGRRPWLELNLDAVAAAGGLSGLPSLLGGAQTSTFRDLGHMLAMLRAAGNVRLLGAATINGIRTTGYSAVVDLGRLARTVPPAGRAAAKQLADELERRFGVERIPVRIWVDARHLVRRESFAISERVPPLGTPLRVAVAVDVLEYGPQPLPVPPPASQVTDITAQLSQALAGSAASSAGG
jgi:hypothetical protein